MINGDWKRVAEQFSNADLQAHPNTNTVMSYFSDNATFAQNGRYSVGKTVASIAFKILCEWGVLRFRNIPEVHLESKDDHIEWSFKSVQLRKGLLPTWLKAPQWYRIDNTAKLYFTGSGNDTKISRIEVIKNDWNKL